MSNSRFKIACILALAGVIALGGGAAFAQSIETRAVPTEHTSRKVNIGTADVDWTSDGTKKLTKNSYGQLSLKGAKGISSANQLEAAARNSSGNIRYPVSFNKVGVTKTYFTNNLGGTVEFKPSLRAQRNSITAISGTWLYTEYA